MEDIRLQTIFHVVRSSAASFLSTFLDLNVVFFLDKWQTVQWVLACCLKRLRGWNVITLITMWSAKGVLLLAEGICVQVLGGSAVRKKEATVPRWWRHHGYEFRSSCASAVSVSQWMNEGKEGVREEVCCASEWGIWLNREWENVKRRNAFIKYIIPGIPFYCILFLGIRIWWITGRLITFWILVVCHFFYYFLKNRYSGAMQRMI